MLCECGQHEATIHEVIITNDQKKVERHLCEQCARKLGISADPYVPISQLISSTSYIMGQIITEPNDELNNESGDELAQSGAQDPVFSSNTPRAAMQPRSSAQACVGCGLTFASFKKSGLLGCPGCYQAFEERIGPMIERAHEGGCSHVGKVPKRALHECKGGGDTTRMDALLGDIRQREERLESLRGRLAKSIHDEEYESAALLRDELTRLTVLAASQIEPTPKPRGSTRTQPAT